MKILCSKKQDGSSAPAMLPASAWLTMALAACCVLFVNPFRETAMQDDWTYALTVRHLLDTGQYRLHDWATANMPFQTYWGALFARFGGYSHGSLRLSTLVLWAFALVAYYFLCREHGFDPQQAGLLVLGLVSCPLALFLCFTFMTDIPYLSCLIIALYLYTRAVRIQDYRLMFAASIAASAAILTRQFGGVLIVAMVLVWAGTEDRGRNVALFAIGLILPLAALGWQIHMILASPNWATQCSLYSQSKFNLDYHELVKSLIWRPPVILHYIAVFALPFAILPAVGLLKDQKQQSGARRWLLPAVITGYLVAIPIAYSHLSASDLPLMPMIPGIQPNVLSHTPWLLLAVRLLLTAMTALGGGLAAASFLSRYQAGSPQLPPHERLLDFVTMGFVLTTLGFWWIADKHLLVFLPYALIVLGRKCAPLLRQYGPSIATFCILIALVSAVYTRKWLTQNEALWKGGEIARNYATQQQTVSSSWEWTSYHYFATFLSQNSSSFDVFVYFNWLSEHKAKADYVVVLEPPADTSWTVAATVTYQPFPLVERRAYVLKRSH